MSNVSDLPVNPQGMVIVDVIKPFEMWFPGMQCGFFPSKAKDLIQQGFAVLPANAEPAEKEPDDGLVGIPDAWRSMHHSKIISLAILIAGGSATPPSNKKDAEAVIEAEIARRAAAAAQ